MRPSVRTLLALASAVASTGLASCGGAPPADAVHVVSVGDSLAVGVQPGLTGAGRTTTQGYPRQFADALRSRGVAVELHELGCGGATSGSVLNGGRDCAPDGDQPYDGDDPLTSQATYAEGLLSRLGGKRVVVLVDVGGNDVGSCLQGGAADPACVQRAGRALRDNLATLLRRLRAAAPAAPIGVLDLYDPVLGLWDEHPEGRPTIAAVHRAFQRDVNRVIAQVSAAGGARVGALGARMDQDRTVDAADGGRPAGVRAVCRYTWMCVQAPLRPDIHLRRSGYHEASEALLRALDPDLRAIGAAP